MVSSDYSTGHSTHTFDRTNVIPLLQTPRFSHTLGSPGPKTHTSSHLFVRAVETTLTVLSTSRRQTSLVFRNTRDVCNVLSVYIGSFNDQSKDPDISSLSLRASKEELSVSFNDQDRAPDDPFHVQDSQCAPCDLSTSSPFSQVFPRLDIRFSTEPLQIPFDFLSSAHQNPVRIPPSRPQVYSRRSLMIICGRFSRHTMR